MHQAGAKVNLPGIANIWSDDKKKCKTILSDNKV